MIQIHVITPENVGKHVFQMSNGEDYVMGSASGPVEGRHIGTRLFRIPNGGIIWLEPGRAQQGGKS